MDIHEILEHLPHRYPFLLLTVWLNWKPANQSMLIKTSQ